MSNERSRQNCIQWLRLQQEENVYRLPIQETNDVPSNLYVTEFGPNQHSTDRGLSFPHISDRSNEITTHYARISYARSVNETPNNASQEFYGHEINITTTQPKTLDINVDFNRTNGNEKLRRRKNAHHKYLKNNHKMMENAISPKMHSEEVEMAFTNNPSVIPQGGDGIKLFSRSNTDHDIKNSKKSSAKQERVNLGNSKIRSKSMNAISSNNSKLNKPELLSKEKNKFYDPEDAKNFIKEQKKKWRANLIGGDKNAAKLQKEIIKKRLEELNANSRQIINKNLKKKEKLKAVNIKNAASISKNNIESKLDDTTSKKTSEDKQKDVENFESVQNPDCVTETLNNEKIKIESGNIILKENEEVNLISTSNLMENEKTDTQCIHELNVLNAKLESVDSKRVDQKLTDNEHKQSDEKAASSSHKNNNILSDYPPLEELQENVEVTTNDKEQTAPINIENLFNSKQPKSQLKSSKIAISSTALLENQKHLGLLRRPEETNYLEKIVKDSNFAKENAVHEISESIANIETNCKGFSSISKKDEECAVKEMLKSRTNVISSGNSRLKDNLNLQKVNENEINDLTERSRFTNLVSTSQNNYINFDNHVTQPIQYKISTQIPTDISLGESHFKETSQNFFEKNERSKYCKLNEDKYNDFSDSSCSLRYSSMPSQRVYGVCNTPLNKIDEDQSKKPFIKEYLPNSISNENIKNDIIKAITDAIAPIATQLKEYKAATQNNYPNANESYFENCSNKTDVINEHESINESELLKQSCEHNNVKQYNCESETSVFSMENTLETKSLSSMKSSVSSSLVQSSKEVEDTASNLLKYLLQPDNSESRPYNFIVAVRQKLHATTNQNQTTTQNNTTQTMQHQQTSTTDLHKNKLTNDSVANNATKKPKDNPRPISCDDKLRDRNYKLDSLDTFSNSCFSAKNIQTSTIKSFKSGSTENILNSSKCKTTYDDDDTTVSSSLLSSPKSQHLPLKLNQGYFLSDSKSVLSSKEVENMENAGELNIQKNFIEVLPCINNTIEVHENSIVFIPNKQTFTRILNKKTGKKKIKNLKPVQMPKNESESHKFQPSETQIGLKKLLYDFNHSLSQVIEFNEKFKNTIDKSHEILSPKHSKTSKPNLKYSTNVDYPYVSSLEPPAKNLDILSSNESEQASNSKHSPNINFYSQTQESVESCSSSGTTTKNEQLQKTNTTFQLDSQCNKFPKKLDLRSSSTQKCIKVENKRVMLFNQVDKKSKLSKKTDPTNPNINFIKTHINNKRGDFFSIKDEKEFLLNMRLNNSANNLPIENDNCIESSSTTATDISNNHKGVTHSDNRIITSFDTKHSIKEECGTQTAIKTKKSKFLETKASRTYGKAEIAGKDSGTIEISNKVEYELSMLPSHCSSEVSEAPLNCSNLELYEKLINNETIRTEQLATLLRMREKALINRTKGQIAWLEVQKKQFKAKALQSQITAIKKKQRGILMKMEKEREEIKRLIHSTTSSTDLKFFINQSGCSSQISIQGLLKVNEKNSFTTRLKQTSPESVPDLFSVLKTPQIIEDPQNKAVANTQSTPILRGNYHLECSHSLEEVLKRRENDIQKRREHVERLMQWHQRLDQEEAQILELEHMLFKYNNTNTNFNESDNFELKQHFSERKITNEKIQNSSSMENRLKEIDRSLRELSSITTTNSSIANTSATNDKNVSASCTSDTSIDYIRTTGSKLNKLWRRLTTQKIEKFDSGRRYKLRKKDLERLYENAKITVLQDFTQDERIAGELLDKSSYYFCKNNITNNQNEAVNKILSSKESLYSLPEVSECKYNEKMLFCKRCEAKKVFDNFFVSSQLPNSHSIGLQRSLSDTQISVFPKGMSETKCQLICQCNLVEYSTAQKNFSENEIDEKQITTVISGERLDNGLSLSCHEGDLCSDIEDLNISSLQELSDSFSECESNNDVESPLKAESNLSNLILENTTEVQKNKNIYIHFEKNETKLNDDDYIKNNKTSSNFFSKKHLLNDNSTNKSEKNLLDPTETMTQKFISLKNSSDSNDIKTNRNSRKNIEIITPSDKLNLVNNCNFNENFVQTQDVENDLKNSGTNDNFNTDSNFEFQTNENTTKLPIFLQPSKSSKENTLSIEDKNIDQSKEEKITLDSYEDDFEDEESQIENMSLPHFENTIETSQEEIESENLLSKVKSETKSHSLGNTIDNREEQKSLLLQNTISQPPSTPKVSATVSSGTTFNAVQHMPDIINEVEKSCYQHIIIENEHLKQFDQIPTVPYMYVREIPNKPPPPYVPPAHGSPMTTIFPSEERIKDITYRFSHEMYCKMFKTEYTNDKGEKLPSVMEEKITNIYERIILDICREYLTENQEILNQSNPINFYSQLAFFNPPDRLRCIQESIYKEVRRCLAMDKLSQKSTQIFSIYGNRANRDHIGKIIMQEMSDEDGKWCNFHREENEVLNLIVEEMIVNKIKDLCKEVFIEEGGTIETEINESSNEIKTENDLTVVSEEPASRSFKIDETTPCVFSSDIDNSNAVPLDSKIDTTVISSS